MSLDPTRIVAVLRQLVAGGDARVPLHEPRFAGHEWDYVKNCLDEGWVSSVGAYVDRFEAELADLCGVRHGVATVNGTAALHVALLVAGVRPDDEVLVPALTFVATANAVMYLGAMPHFVDSDERTLGLDPAALARHLEAIAEPIPGGDGFRNRQTGRRLTAVVPMHAFGHPVDMDALDEVAEAWKLAVVEDATESLGSSYKGRPCGSFGRAAALSFNGNKIVTTGGGGAVMTDDEDLAKLAKHLTTTAKTPHRWAFEHDMVAFNYRLPNINAALGCAQLEQLPGFLAAKRRLAERYREAFAGIGGLRFVVEPEDCHSNYWLNAILLDEAEASQRDEILDATNDAGIMTRPAWTLMHRLPMYRDCPRADLAVAESLERRLINLPSSAVLGGASDDPDDG